MTGSNLRYQPVSVDYVVQLWIPELARVRYGGDGDRSVVVCGWLSWGRDLTNPLVASLPALFPRLAGPAHVGTVRSRGNMGLRRGAGGEGWSVSCGTCKPDCGCLKSHFSSPPTERQCQSPLLQRPRHHSHIKPVFLVAGKD